MMSAILTLALAALGVAALLCFTALRAWRGWLELRRDLERPAASPEPAEHVGLRIELAAVRERLRKLEVIAGGVDL